MKIGSILSQKRENKRNSPETLEFKNKVNEFLKGAKPEIEYAIKRDLACMTNMPFYKDRPKVIKFKMNRIDLLCEYVELFSKYTDEKFIVELIKKLGTNQSQTMRKLAPRIGQKSDIWEHVIPTKVITDEIIKMVLSKNLTDLRKLLEIYQTAGQRGLNIEQNKLLDKYRSSIPNNWDWRNENSDPFARHTEVGIIHK